MVLKARSAPIRVLSTTQTMLRHPPMRCAWRAAFPVPLRLVFVHVGHSCACLPCTVTKLHHVQRTSVLQLQSTLQAIEARFKMGKLLKDLSKPTHNSGGIKEASAILAIKRVGRGYHYLMLWKGCV